MSPRERAGTIINHKAEAIDKDKISPGLRSRPVGLMRNLGLQGRSASDGLEGCRVAPEGPSRLFGAAVTLSTKRWNGPSYAEESRTRTEVSSLMLAVGADPDRYDQVPSIRSRLTLGRVCQELVACHDRWE